MEMPINNAGIALLEEFEDFVGHAYPDPYSALGKALRKRGLWRKYLKKAFALPADLAALSGAPWTIGYGFTHGVQEGDRITRVEANRRLATELLEYVDPITKACRRAEISYNDNQLAAMACMAWNIGVGRFLKSSVFKAHLRHDYQAAARAFGLWNKAGGEESPGLTRRRAAEAALYLKPVEEDEPLPMPQAVEPESSLKRSPIVTATTGIGTLTLVAEGSRQVKDIREGLGDWLPYAAVAGVLVMGGWVVWQRVKQRTKGWA